MGNKMMEPKQVVMEYQKALGSGNWTAARGFLKDDLEFKGPIAQYDRPEPYIEDLKRLHNIVKGARHSSASGTTWSAGR